MKFPIRDSVLELILSVPVYPCFEGVKFNKSVVAKALVAVFLRNLIPMVLIKFVGEKIRDR